MPSSGRPRLHKNGGQCGTGLDRVHVIHGSMTTWVKQQASRGLEGPGEGADGDRSSLLTTRNILTHPPSPRYHTRTTSQCHMPTHLQLGGNAWSPRLSSQSLPGCNGCRRWAWGFCMPSDPTPLPSHCLPAQHFQISWSVVESSHQYDICLCWYCKHINVPWRCCMACLNCCWNDVPAEARSSMNI